MTIDVKAGTVITAIAGLSITGVNVKDITTIPENPDFKLPALFPQPDAPVTNIAPDFQSFGSGGTAKIDLQYSLHYIYLHAPVGSKLGLNSVLSGMLTNVTLIMEAILTNDVVTGAVDLELESLPSIGVIIGPNGREYHGAMFSFRVLEHVQ